MLILDTNVLLRFLLDDNKAMADEAEKLIDENEILIPFEVVAEIVYVLGSIYKMERNQIVQTLKGLFVNHVAHSPDDAQLAVALDCFMQHKLDFVDCLLVGYHKAGGHEVFTFDKALKRQLG